MLYFLMLLFSIIYIVYYIYFDFYLIIILLNKLRMNRNSSNSNIIPGNSGSGSGSGSNNPGNPKGPNNIDSKIICETQKERRNRMTRESRKRRRELDDEMVFDERLTERNRLNRLRVDAINAQAEIYNSNNSNQQINSSNSNPVVTVSTTIGNPVESTATNRTISQQQGVSQPQSVAPKRSNIHDLLNSDDN